MKNLLLLVAISFVFGSSVGYFTAKHFIKPKEIIKEIPVEKEKIVTVEKPITVWKTTTRTKYLEKTVFDTLQVPKPETLYVKPNKLFTESQRVFLEGGKVIYGRYYFDTETFEIYVEESPVDIVEKKKSFFDGFGIGIGVGIGTDFKGKYFPGIFVGITKEF